MSAQQQAVNALAVVTEDPALKAYLAEHDPQALAQARAALAALRADRARVEALEALAEAVRRGLDGLPDRPWIPGVSARPVAAALLALDGALPTRDRTIPLG